MELIILKCATGLLSVIMFLQVVDLAFTVKLNETMF